jgi:hypothetical protein
MQLQLVYKILFITQNILSLETERKLTKHYGNLTWVEMEVIVFLT